MQPAAAARRRAAAVRQEPKLGAAGKLLIALWVIVLFDPQWLLASFGARPALKAPVILFAALLLTLVFQVPANRTWSRRWNWYAPLLLFIAAGMAAVPIAPNRGYAIEFLELLLLYWALIAGTAVILRTPQWVEKLFLLYGASFVWWGLWGSWRGAVPWHFALFNEDGFGAFAVVGVGFCTYLTVAAPKGSRFRQIVTLAAALSLIGVVASFARGAFLAAVAVGLLVWYRSANKGKATAIGIAGAVLVVLAANVLHPGKFWAEMETAFTHGTESGTSEDRWILWNAAWEVFKERPVFGAGPRNFGPFAASYFEPGDLLEGGRGYSNNPRILYNRSLHNVYMQILSEYGAVGMLAFLWMLVDFWKRNAALRAARAAERWRQLGGRLHLPALALALEAGMVGYLVPCMFYGLLGVHWFWTILAVNLTLHLTYTNGVKLLATGNAPRRLLRHPSGAGVPARSAAPPLGGGPHARNALWS